MTSTEQSADRWTGERVALGLVAGITLIGLGLRLPSFGDSLFGDELSAYFIVAGHSFGQMMHLLSGHSTELNPPLFFMLAWTSQKIFGLSAESLKLVSLLAGTVTIPLTYVLARRTVGHLTGVIASALVATSPFLIYYSTEARPYALLVLLVLLSTLALLQALNSPGWGWWAAYALFACAAAYTHFTAVFCLAAQFLWAAWTHPKARLGLVLATATAVIGYLPEIPVLRTISRSPGTKLYGALEQFNFSTVRFDLGHWAIGHPYLSVSQAPGTAGALLVLAAVAIALTGVALQVMPHPPRWRRAASGRKGPFLVIVLALAAPVGVILYSALHQSIWGARNVISSWPAFAALLAGFVCLPKRGWREGAIAALLLGFALGGISMLSQSHRRPDYDAAVGYIDSVDGSGGPIVELTAPTPGPPTETEAALALAGTAKQHPVIRVGHPPLAAVLAAPPYARVSQQSGQTVAHEAAALAGSGVLFIVGPTSIPVSALEHVRRLHFNDNSNELGRFSTFLGALPARFRPVTSRTFAGLNPVTVYVYRG